MVLVALLAHVQGSVTHCPYHSLNSFVFLLLITITKVKVNSENLPFCTCLSLFRGNIKSDEDSS